MSSHVNSSSLQLHSEGARTSGKVLCLGIWNDKMSFLLFPYHVMSEDTKESPICSLELQGTLKVVFISEYWKALFISSAVILFLKCRVLGHNPWRFWYDSSVVCSYSLESNSSKWPVLKISPSLASFLLCFQLLYSIAHSLGIYILTSK